MRYVALAILQRVVDIDLQAVQRHRATVLECVKDPDTSIRRRALDLSYALATEANVKDLVADLLEYIANGCDADFKPDLTGKLCTMVQRFAADQRWCIDCMTRLLVTAGAHVQEESCRALLVLITNAPGLQV